jgi:hypothetical protein
MQPAYGRLEVGLLVVDGDDDVEHGPLEPSVTGRVEGSVDAHGSHGLDARCPALVPIM